MTAHPLELVTATVRTRPRILARLVDAALAVLLAALLSGAWLAFFLSVPFDFTPPRP